MTYMVEIIINNACLLDIYGNVTENVREYGLRFWILFVEIIDLKSS